MTLRIGRIPAIVEPMEWRNQGDVVEIRGRLGAGSAAAALILRDQLLGYDRNLDEPVVPILLTGEPKLTGYYRLAGVEVPTTPAMLLATGMLEYVVRGQRITGYISAALEAVLAGGLRVNDHGINAATALPFHSPGSGVYEYLSWAAAATNTTRPYYDDYGAGAGNVLWFQSGSSYAGLTRYAVAPADYYGGAVTLFNGAHIVCGKQEAPTAAASAASWTISNGLVMIVSNAAGTYFDLYWTSGGINFKSHRQVYIKGTNSDFLNTSANTNVRILRNSPEEVIIRVPAAPAAGLAYTPTYMDISVRRGSRIVTFYCVLPYNVSPQTWLFGQAFAGIASTTLTGGLRDTSNDSDGNRSVIMTSRAKTDALATGRFTTNVAASAFDCGIGLEVGGSGATGFDTAQSQIYQYMAAQGERQQVVGR